MKRRIFMGSALATAVLSACSQKFRPYTGPEVTSIVVNKSARRMYLLHNDDVLKDYKVDLGFAPDGPKQFRGDGKTPEGTYRIDRRNPRSSYFLSLGISYPNSKDRALASAAGKDPGGDIFIHGQPNNTRAKGRDWTAGCISVKDKEMSEIYSMVQVGTIITLRA
ncbi:MAG: L,D-transpeptidase family protein [Pseudomonadota bacterium]